MKRTVLTLVALLALLFTVETAKADWVFYTNNGWAGWRWDPGFPDDRTPKYPPPISGLFFISISITGDYWAFPLPF